MNVRKMKQSIEIPVLIESSTPEYNIPLNSEVIDFFKFSPEITVTSVIAFVVRLLTIIVYLN